MTFSQAAEKLNLESYPPELDIIDTDLAAGRKTSPFGRDLIENLQNKYTLFQERYPEILAGYEEIMRDEARKIWVETVSLYAKTCTLEEMRKLKLPETDGTLAGNLASYFVLLARAEDAAREYASRGFSEEEVRAYLAPYHRGLGTLYPATGKIGFTRVYFNWTCLYAFVSIFHAGGFQFQISATPAYTYVLKKKTDGQVCVLLDGIRVSEDGLPLGYAGSTSEEEGYPVSWDETESEFVGYPVENDCVALEKRFFSKNEWELILKPGDEVFSLHIPKGASLDPKNVQDAVELAEMIARERFPERKVKGVRCTSWLLNPHLVSFLGSDSRIVCFSRLFACYPVKDRGDSIYQFVFSGKPKDLRDLPEKTSLQKKAKAFLLAGNVLTNYGGFLRDTFK